MSLWRIRPFTQKLSRSQGPEYNTDKNFLRGVGKEENSYIIDKNNRYRESNYENNQIKRFNQREIENKIKRVNIHKSEDGHEHKNENEKVYQKEKILKPAVDKNEKQSEETNQNIKEIN